MSAHLSFDPAVLVFANSAALLLNTIAHACHKSTSPHTCSLNFAILCYKVKSKGQWLWATPTSSIQLNSSSVLFNVFLTWMKD